MLCGYDICSGSNICGKIIANPNFGIINFDNIFYSFLMVFQCITLEGWTQIMFYYVRTFSIYMVFFFIPLVWIGAYFLVNLTLAVINTTFNQKRTIKGEEKVEIEKIIDENAITIEDIRNMKLGERSHHKRTLRIMGNHKKYGASEVDQQAEKNKGEMRWEDLLELKERIIEEQERLDAEENFNKLREKELDKKQKKIKPIIKKPNNMKYLPKMQTGLQLKSLQAKIIPLKLFTETSKNSNRIQLINISGVKDPNSLDWGHRLTRDFEDEQEQLFLKSISDVKPKKIENENRDRIDIFSLKNKKKITNLMLNSTISSKSPKVNRRFDRKSSMAIEKVKVNLFETKKGSFKLEKNTENLRKESLKLGKSQGSFKLEKKKGSFKLENPLLQRKLTYDDDKTLKKQKKRSIDIEPVVEIKSINEIKSKKSLIHEYLLEKMAKDEDIGLKKGLDFGLDFDTSSISSLSSDNSSQSILNDSDFNIGFVEVTAKKQKSKRKMSSIKDFSLKKLALTDKNLEFARRKSKKTSIMVNDDEDKRKSRTSKKIMSNVMLNLQDEFDSDENSPGIGVEIEEPKPMQKSQRKLSRIMLEKEADAQFPFKDPPKLLERFQQNDTFQFKSTEGKSKGKILDRLKQKGIFKRIFTINAFSRNNKKIVDESMLLAGRRGGGLKEEDNSPRRRRGFNNEIQLKKFRKLVLKKKKPNVLHYKIMINHEKPYESNSQKAVLEYREEKEREKNERILEEKIKSIKYNLSYTPKVFKQKKISKSERKRQKQLLKEMIDNKKKSIDFQSLDNILILKKILNIDLTKRRIPIALRNNLVAVIQQQRQFLFAGRLRSKKTTMSGSISPTNVSMISNTISPLLGKQTQLQRLANKKKKKKVVEIEEKLTFSEWRVRIREKVGDKIDKKEIDEKFTNKIDFMTIRVSNFFVFVHFSLFLFIFQ